jgi:hypothetical protein
MESQYYCKDCKLTFNSPKGLSIHLTKSNIHKGIKQFNCIYCNKNLSCNQRKISHEEICKERKKKEKMVEEEQKEIEYKQASIYILNEIETLKTIIENKNKFINELQTELQSTKLLKNHILEQSEKQTDKLLNKLSKPTTINNKITNNTFVLIQNMPSVKEHEIQEILSTLTFDELANGEEAIGTALSNKYFKKRVVCTDLSRNTLCWKEEDNEPVRDIQGKMIINKIKKAGHNEFNKFKVMLDTKNEQMDKTCPEEIIRFNNAWTTSEQLTSSLKFKNMSKVIAKNVPHKKQLDLTDDKRSYTTFYKTLEDLITKKPVVTNKFYEGFRDFFSYLSDHYKEQKCLYSSYKLFHMCLEETLLFFFQENGFTFFVDDKREIVEDEGHSLFILSCFSILKKNKDCLPFYFSDEETEYIEKNDLKYAQHCIEESIKDI